MARINSGSPSSQKIAVVTFVAIRIIFTNVSMDNH